EDHPYLAGQRARGGRPGEEEAGAEHYGRVHVVPARVAGTRIQRPVTHAFLVDDWQRVDVGAQGNDRLLVSGATDVGDNSSALRQDRRAQPGLFEARGNLACRAVLGVTDLGVGMQVAPELNQL